MINYWKLSIVLMFLPVYAFSQSISGKITDEKGLTLPGATAVIEGTTFGASADFDGNFKITGIKPGTYNVKAQFLGFKTSIKSVTVGSNQDVKLDFTLAEDAELLEEVVVIGYGTQKKEDLTGSIVSLSSDDFQEGNVNTPEQLVLGKVAGVQITPNGGNPGSGSTIRIRGGSSLNASNDPLIVIDGVPLANDGIAGSPNPLSLINPNDIENITVLKDASATAIYGSRASNGVILITTKKAEGKSKLSVEFNTVNSMSVVAKYADVFTADELRSYLQERDTNAVQLLGTANTDWQKEIYRTAFSTDNLLSLSGGLEKVPYRLSVGFLDQNGVLITDNMKRTTANLNLSPKFFDDRLKIDINSKFANSQSQFANQGAVGAAVAFDPTQPVTTSSPRWGGFFEWESGQIPNNLAVRNPVALIELRDDQSNVNRFIGNALIDYQMHFLPELRANLNLGYDYSLGKGTVRTADSAAAVYSLQNQGRFAEYEQLRTNELLEFYFNYKKDLNSIKSTIDAVAGYSYQDWYFESPNIRELDGSGDTIVGSQAPVFPLSQAQNRLISFYGRLNYTLAQKYLFTFTLRRDGSSRFAEDERWGLFPSAAFAWRIAEEKFMDRFDNLSDLKLRLGYGQTGQQDVGVNANFLPLYTLGESTAQYQLGNQFINTLRPTVYDPGFKWETTVTYNAGLDIGFYNGRITGAIDYYYRRTTDLIAEINIPTGINFGSRVLTNVGEIENQGLEILINTVPLVREDLEVTFGVNMTLNRNKILKLDRFPDPNDLGTEVGGIAGQIGDFIQINTVGQPVNSFFVFEQKYGPDGKPIEVGRDKGDGTTYTALDAFVDRNNDSLINNLDRYHFKNPIPQVLFGFNSTVTWKKWSAGFIGRLSIGNYVYNNFASNTGNLQNISSAIGVVNNGSTDALETDFLTKNTESIKSDYYVQNASFFRLDNLNLGYNYGEIMKGQAYLRLFATIQNALVLTNYSGVDPEVFSGIDNIIYPRPVVFSIGANIKI